MRVVLAIIHTPLPKSRDERIDPGNTTDLALVANP
jgi:hypothetical protein